MSHLSRMKNPDLPCPSVAAALRAYSYVLSSLDIRPQEPLLPSLAYQGRGSLRPSYALPIACRVLLLLLCFPYLDHPLCAISCIDHCYIRHASSPPKAY